MPDYIENIKQITNPLAEKYGLKRMFLFGSRARGDATTESDYDFYMEKGKLRTLVEYFSLINELESALGCHVDLVSKDIRDHDFLNTIESEGILLYESF